MINDHDLTLIASFGEAVADSGSVVMEIDEVKHKDADGNMPSEFPPLTEVFFLVHHDPAETKIVSVKATDGGDIQRIGEVTRTKTQRLTFASDEAVQLSHLPSGTVTVTKLYGKTGTTFKREGRALTPSAWPCLAEVSYPVRMIQYKHRIVSGYVLDGDDKFYAAAVCEHEEVG